MAKASRFLERVRNRCRLKVREVILGQRQFFMRLLEQSDKCLRLVLVRRFAFDGKGTVRFAQIGPRQCAISVSGSKRIQKRLGSAKDVARHAVPDDRGETNRRAILFGTDAVEVDPPFLISAEFSRDVLLGVKERLIRACNPRKIRKILAARCLVKILIILYLFRLGT